MPRGVLHCAEELDPKNEGGHAMSDEASSIAEAINQKARSFRAGTVLFWDYAPVQPDDDEYKIAEAVAAPGRLDLKFEHKGRSAGKKAQVLSLHDPKGFVFGGGKLQIKSASRIVWGEVEVALQGNEVEIRGGGEPSRRPHGKTAALELRAAIGT